MIRERPSSAPPSCCRLRSEDDPVREDGGPSRVRNLARPRVVLARAVHRVVIVEGTIDGEMDNPATTALRDYESTEGCLNNPPPVRHTTEGGGAGLGSSGVHDCSRPPSSSARLDEWETQRALVEASRLVETAQGAAQSRGQVTAHVPLGDIKSQSRVVQASMKAVGRIGGGDGTGYSLVPDDAMAYAQVE